MTGSLFQKDFYDLITGNRQSHMGMHMYEDHKGMRGNKSMSGSKLWEDLADNEPTYNIARNDIKLLQNSIASIATQLPTGLNLIDLGPGAEESISNKSLKIIQSIQASSYQPVDGSPFFAECAGNIVKQALPDLNITPTVDNIFSMQQIADLPSLTYFGGSTLGNLIHPVSEEFPEELLVNALADLARHNPDGWTLTSFDSVNDEERLGKAYGNKRCKDFVSNVLYRASVELPLSGFNHDAFKATYKWIKESYQLASFVEATHAQDFILDGTPLHIEKGQEFHIVNSYKFSPKLFKDAAMKAGLKIEYLMTDASGMILVLLKNAVAQDRVLPIAA